MSPDDSLPSSHSWGGLKATDILPVHEWHRSHNRGHVGIVEVAMLDLHLIGCSPNHDGIYGMTAMQS